MGFEIEASESNDEYEWRGRSRGRRNEKSQGGCGVSLMATSNKDWSDTDKCLLPRDSHIDILCCIQIDLAPPHCPNRGKDDLPKASILHCP